MTDGSWLSCDATTSGLVVGLVRKFSSLKKVWSARATIRKRLEIFSTQNICSDDEVAVFYRCLPSRALHDSGRRWFTRVKDRMTAILTVFADGTEAPLTIIGKCARSRSCPRDFKSDSELGISYTLQKNSWKTQTHWTNILKGFKNMARLQGRQVVNVIDHCSVHSIDYSSFDNDINH